MSAKIGKNEQYIREQISKRSGRHNISSEAEMVLWARSLNIGTNIYVNKLPPHIQNEIRTYKSSNHSTSVIVNTKKIYSDKKRSKKKWHETWWGQFLLFVIIGGALATIIGGVVLKLIGI